MMPKPKPETAPKQNQHRNSSAAADASETRSQALLAGAAVGEITPQESQFLYGYPHVERWSTGVHDPLLTSALYLDDGNTSCIISANDIVGFDKPLIERIRHEIQALTTVAKDRIFITASHTHSGPRTVMHDASLTDPVVPPPDPAYVEFLIERVVETAVRAARMPVAVTAEFALARAEGIGTNRRDPEGPADPDVPVFLFRRIGGEPLASLLIYSMHPTVLHEDSTLISADFPGLARRQLQRDYFGTDLPILMLMGASGNQSPRHVTRANTFAEAERIGGVLAAAVAAALRDAEPLNDPGLEVRHVSVDLPRRSFPRPEEAADLLNRRVVQLEGLRSAGASSREIRTAECDWFGAEEILTLTTMHADGRLEATYRRIMPADITAIGIGGYWLIGWPCEFFIEYQLQLKAHLPDLYPVSLANGELHGYIVTRQAAEEGGYEASNTLWGAEAGERLLEESLRMMGKQP